MDVILPVAGLGTRLRPQTWSKPKPLVSLAGKPMLEHVLDRVLPEKPRRLIFITGFLGNQIERWAKDHYDIPVSFVEQPEMRGQCDAIIRTRGIVPDDQDALILFPDMIFEADFSQLASVDADGVMYTKEVEDPSALGIAVVEGDRITKLVEKPKEPISNLAVIGIYYVRRAGDLFDAIEEQMRRGISLKGEYFIADAFQLMIDAGKKVITAPVSVWEDCGNVNALLQSNRYLLNTNPPSLTAREGAVIIPPSFVDDEAVLERCIVGPHVSVGPGAVVRNSVVRDTIIEADATVEATVVEHSLVGRGAQLVGRPVRANIGDTSVVQS